MKKKSEQPKQIDFTQGKVPPNSPDVEKIVLGSILLERSAFDTVSEKLTADVFYSQTNRLVYEAMMNLSANSRLIDIFTVAEQLVSNGKLDEVGGAYYLTKLTDNVVSTAGLEQYCLILLQHYMKRSLITHGINVATKSLDDTTDVFDIINEADKSFTEITTTGIKKSYTKIDNAVFKSVTRIEDLRVKGGDVTGVPTGFKSLDSVTYGWQNTDLIILAARPSVGKTALALNFLRNAAANEIKPTPAVFFSMEMSEGQLVNRLLSAESGVFLERLQRGDLDDFWMKELYKKGVDPVCKMPIFIDDTPGLTLAEVKSKARNLKRKENIGLIIIDYLQLMSGSGNQKTREQEISSISRGLKGLAKELEVPVIALSQLSRETEKRSGDAKMPQLSDLRESGAIEQDADMVMFLYRPEYYGVQSDFEGESTKGKTIVKIAKNRSGKLAEIELTARLDIQKFYDSGYQFSEKSQISTGGNWKPVSEILNDDNPF